MSFLSRWLVTAIAAAVAVFIVPGIDIVGGGAAWVSIAAFGLTLALVNAIIKPILQFLGAPISFLTLGLFYLIINTCMLYLAAGLANSLFGAGFYISGFFSAFFASIVISIVSAIANFFIGE